MLHRPEDRRLRAARKGLETRTQLPRSCANNGNFVMTLSLPTKSGSNKCANRTQCGRDVAALGGPPWRSVSGPSISSPTDAVGKTAVKRDFVMQGPSFDTFLDDPLCARQGERPAAETLGRTRSTGGDQVPSAPRRSSLLPPRPRLGVDGPTKDANLAPEGGPEGSL